MRQLSQRQGVENQYLVQSREEPAGDFGIDQCSSMMKNSKIGGSGWRQIRKAGKDWDHSVRSLQTGRVAGLLQGPGGCHQGPAWGRAGPWVRALIWSDRLT